MLRFYCEVKLHFFCYACCSYTQQVHRSRIIHRLRVQIYIRFFWSHFALYFFLSDWPIANRPMLSCLPPHCATHLCALQLELCPCRHAVSFILNQFNQFSLFCPLSSRECNTFIQLPAPCESNLLACHRVLGAHSTSKGHIENILFTSLLSF